MRKSSMIIWFFLLSGCATPSTTTPKPTYFGLDKGSYGHLSSAPLRLCDPERTMYLAPGTESLGGINAHEISRDLTSILLAPLSDMMKIDESIKVEGLKDAFRIPGDSDSPNVALLNRDKDGILFWYKGQLISKQEVDGAAKKYCEKQGRTVVFEGAALTCPDPVPVTLPFVGTTIVKESHVIASFKCLGAPVPTPVSSPTQKTKKKKP